MSTFGHVSSSTKPTFGSPKSQTGSSSGLFTVPPVNPQPNPFVAPLQTTSGLFGGQPTNTDSARNKKAEINTASTLFGRPSSGPSTFGQSVFGQPWFGQHRSDPSLFGQSSFESSQSSTESSRKDATVPGDNDRGVFGSSNTSAQPNKTTDHILDSGLFTKPAGSLFTAENIAQLKKNPGLFGSSTHTKSSLFSTVGGNTLASTPSLAPDQSTRFGGFESSSANAPLTSTLSGPARASIFGASPYSSTQPTSTRAYFGASFGQSTPSSTATAQPGAASGGFGSGSFGAPLSQSTSSSTATAQPSTTGGVFGGGGFSSGGFGAGGFGAPSTLSNLAPANPNPPNSAGTIFGASTSSSTFGQASTTATAFGGRLSNQSRKDDASKERDKKK